MDNLLLSISKLKIPEEWLREQWTIDLVSLQTKDMPILEFIKKLEGLVYAESKEIVPILANKNGNWNISNTDPHASVDANDLKFYGKLLLEIFEDVNTADTKKDQEKKGKIAWLITGSNPFWRIWKGQFVTGNTGASHKMVVSVVTAGEVKVLEMLKQLFNLTVITLSLMEKINKAVTKEEWNANMELKLMTDGQPESVTLPLWKWALCCSQSATRCGLWKTLTLVSGGKKLRTNIIGSDEDSCAVAYLFKTIGLEKAIPKTLPFASQNYADVGRKRLDTIKSNQPSAPNTGNQQDQNPGGNPADQQAQNPAENANQQGAQAQQGALAA